MGKNSTCKVFTELESLEYTSQSPLKNKLKRNVRKDKSNLAIADKPSKVWKVMPFRSRCVYGKMSKSNQYCHCRLRDT